MVRSSRGGRAGDGIGQTEGDAATADYPPEFTAAVAGDVSTEPLRWRGDDEWADRQMRLTPAQGDSGWAEQWQGGDDDSDRLPALDALAAEHGLPRS